MRSTPCAAAYGATSNPIKFEQSLLRSRHTPLTITTVMSATMIGWFVRRQAGATGWVSCIADPGERGFVVVTLLPPLENGRSIPHVPVYKEGLPVLRPGRPQPRRGRANPSQLKRKRGMEGAALSRGRGPCARSRASPLLPLRFESLPRWGPLAGPQNAFQAPGSPLQATLFRKGERSERGADRPSLPRPRGRWPAALSELSVPARQERGGPAGRLEHRGAGRRVDVSEQQTVNRPHPTRDDRASPQPAARARTASLLCVRAASSSDTAGSCFTRSAN